VVSSGRLRLSRISRYSCRPLRMSSVSRLDGGASKPVCRMALLALEAPLRISGPRSRITDLGARQCKLASDRAAHHSGANNGDIAGVLQEAFARLHTHARARPVRTCGHSLGPRCAAG